MRFTSEIILCERQRSKRGFDSPHPLWLMRNFRGVRSVLRVIPTCGSKIACTWNCIVRIRDLSVELAGTLVGAASPTMVWKSDHGNTPASDGALTRHLASAEKSPKRSEHTTWEIACPRGHIRWLLCERPWRPTMHLAGNSWYLVDGQVDVVSGARRAATRGGELI